jgi:hypothetical protein
LNRVKTTAVRRQQNQQFAQVCAAIRGREPFKTVARKNIAIYTLADDFHALVIQKTLQDRYGVKCCVVETDRICGGDGLSWSNLDRYEPTFSTTDCERINARELDLIWWRRGYVHQQIPDEVTDPASIDVINNDCRFALFGVLFNEFKGVWVSEPQATRYAQNKLVQLNVAERAGFRTPRTLVSQNQKEIQHVCTLLSDRVVVKVVRGAKRAPLLAAMIDRAALDEGDSIRLCPTMYQEFIPGTRHVRACCFGESVYAALLDSSDLDWRDNLNIPVTTFELSDGVKARLREVLKALGIRIGIFDLKFDGDSDEPVWLEVNPQGQFLFIEGLCGLPLAAAFSEFLYREATGTTG